MNLEKLGEKTFCLLNPVNVGFYLLNESDVCVIDTGSSKDYGREISKVIEENNWYLKMIINTHSHADHISGNAYLQNKYNCKIYSSDVESYMINCPEFEPIMLYGAKPMKEFYNPFLMAHESVCEKTDNLSVEGLEVIDLSGHSKEMIGIKTSDDVLFCGDAFASPKTLEKYTVQYIYDVKDFVDKLEFLKTYKCKYFIPSHGDIAKDISEVININLESIKNIEELILNILNKKCSYEELIKQVFDYYHIKMNIVQYYLIGTTIKSFLSKLLDEKKITIFFENNLMYYQEI